MDRTRTGFMHHPFFRRSATPVECGQIMAMAPDALVREHDSNRAMPRGDASLDPMGSNMAFRLRQNHAGEVPD